MKQDKMLIDITGKPITGYTPQRPASADRTMSTMLPGVGSPLPWSGYNTDKSKWIGDRGIPLKSVQHLSLESSTRNVDYPPAPNCVVCGMTADAEPHKMRWWCNFCAAVVWAPHTPNAMLPRTTGDTYAAAMSDVSMELLCTPCMTNMLALKDNSGYRCPKCGDIHKRPPTKRMGPII
jgi:predicted RNA-binding Zn-ribbon protein involved in translation (DUF1610 family)